MNITKVTNLDKTEIQETEILNRNAMINDFEELCGYSREEAIIATNNVFKEDDNF